MKYNQQYSDYKDEFVHFWFANNLICFLLILQLLWIKFKKNIISILSIHKSLSFKNQSYLVNLFFVSQV